MPKPLGNLPVVLALVAAVAGLLAGPAGAATTLVKETSVVLGSAIAHDIAITGGHAYVATDAGLTVLDLANPGAPVVRGTVALPTGSSNGVAVLGQYAYVATLSALQVVNVANPAAPVIAATRKLPKVWDVAVKDNIAYVVSYNGELYLFDISAPTNPKQIKVLGLLSWKYPGQDPDQVAKMKALVDSGNAKGTGVSVAGNYLISVDWNYGRMYAWDVAVASQPVFKGTHAAPFLMNAQADPDNDVVYMLSAYGATSGIYSVPISYLVANVSTRQDTCPVCGYFKSDGKMDMGGMGIAPGGNYVFFAGGKLGEVHVVDVQNVPTMLNAASTTLGAHYVKMPYALGLAALGNRLYVAAGRFGVVVFNVPGLSN
jgi:hypothetical protein